MAESGAYDDEPSMSDFKKAQNPFSGGGDGYGQNDSLWESLPQGTDEQDASGRIESGQGSSNSFARDDYGVSSRQGSAYGGGAFGSEPNVYGDDSNGNDKNDAIMAMPSSSQEPRSHLGDANDDLQTRQAKLLRKERELEERKERLDRLEKEVNSQNVREDNWPCMKYPITYHSIMGEIPVFARPHMKRMYSICLFTFLTLFWNFCAVLGMYMVGKANSSDVLFASVYFGTGIFGSWKLWYRQIYYGLRDKKSVKWWVFFFFFFSHVAFCLLCCVAPDDWPPGAAGVWKVSPAFNYGGAMGICVLVATAMWGILCGLSGLYLWKSWRLFRMGGGLAQAKRELQREAANQLISQGAQNAFA